MKNLIHLDLPAFTLIVMFFKKPLVLIASITSISLAKVVVPVVPTITIVDIRQASYILAFMFLADFVTGLLASYFTWRASDRKERWFFGKGEGFSSDKFKKCFVKLIVYTGAPFMVQRFQDTFMLKNLKYATVSEAEFGIATVLIVVFCLNEGYSIFHENLPKCGFNLWHQIKKMIGFYKEVKKEITE